MKKEFKSGIYIIENTINGKVYVGQSVNLNRRWASHKSAYKRYSEGRESCWHQALWNAFDKYGIDKFEYKIIAKCPKEYLNRMEIKFIQLYNSYNKGYNCDKGGKGGVPSKPIFQFTKEGNLVKKWNSVKEVCNVLGFKSQNNIRAAMANKNNQHIAYGFIWSFEDDGKDRAISYKNYLENKTNRVVAQESKKVSMYSFEGELLEVFKSIKDCAKHLKVNSKNLPTSIKNCYGASNKVILIKDGECLKKAFKYLSTHRLYKKHI